MNAAYLEPLPGDSLFVSDIQQSRYTVLDSAGGVARVVSVAALARGTRVTPLGMFSNGKVLAWAPRFADLSGPALQHLTATIYLVDATGTQAESLAVLPFTIVQPMSFGGGQGWRAALGTGQMQPAITPHAAFLNSPTQDLVHVYRATSGAWLTISGSAPVRLGTPAVAERARKDAVDHGASPEYMARVPVADTLPAIHSPFVTAEGRLWLLEGAVDPVSQRRGMTTYDRTGRLDGRLMIPAGYYPIAVSESLMVFIDRETEGSVLHIHRIFPKRQ